MSRDDWRVITVKQPWAAVIAGGYKTVENRSRGSSWRGQLAIHAGLGYSDRGDRDDRVHEVLKECLLVSCTPGAVVAVCELVDVHPDTDCCRPWGESYYHDTMADRKVTQVFHYLLEGIRPVVPALSARGRLGLWRPDPDLALELDRVAQLG